MRIHLREREKLDENNHDNIDKRGREGASGSEKGE